MLNKPKVSAVERLGLAWPGLGFSNPETSFRIRTASVFAGCLLAMFASCQNLVACPTCKETLGHHALQMQQGYALSILFMIAVPFGLLSAWTVAIFRMVKAAEAAGGNRTQGSSLESASHKN